MGKSAYIGLADKARKIKTMYVGVDGKARKIKKAWIGDANGKAREWWSGGKGSNIVYVSKASKGTTSSNRYVTGFTSTDKATTFAQTASKLTTISSSSSAKPYITYFNEYERWAVKTTAIPRMKYNRMNYVYLTPNAELKDPTTYVTTTYSPDCGHYAFSASPTSQTKIDITVSKVNWPDNYSKTTIGKVTATFSTSCQFNASSSASVVAVKWNGSSRACIIIRLTNYNYDDEYEYAVVRINVSDTAVSLDGTPFILKSRSWEGTDDENETKGETIVGIAYAGGNVFLTFYRSTTYSWNGNVSQWYYYISNGKVFRNNTELKYSSKSVQLYEDANTNPGIVVTKNYIFYKMDGYTSSSQKNLGTPNYTSGVYRTARTGTAFTYMGTNFRTAYLQMSDGDNLYYTYSGAKRLPEASTKPTSLTVNQTFVFQDDDGTYQPE